MHYASRSNAEILSYLIEKNPRFINTKDMEGNTPLHIACIENRLLNVEVLISFGADVYIRNNWN